jgi:hypothetical protein
MTFRIKALLAGLLLMCSQAHAGVIYRWQPVGDGPDALPKDLFFEIGFSDAAVAAGSVDFVIDSCGWAPFCDPDPEAPVTHFLFGGPTPPIYFNPRKHAMDPFAMLTVSVRFEAGGLLSGFISAHDTMSNFDMDSTGGTLFTIGGVWSDYPLLGGCDPWGGDCHGATGEMRAMPAPQPVPEPGTQALLAGAIAALLGARLKRRT